MLLSLEAVGADGLRDERLGNEGGGELRLKEERLSAKCWAQVEAEYEVVFGVARRALVVIEIERRRVRI